MINILFYLLILGVTNIFGIFNVLEEYRIPGVGKPSDFVLYLLILLTLNKVINNKVKLNKQEYNLVKADLIVVVYVLFLVFYTVFIKNIETFNYSLRVGANFFYYISFIFPIILINDIKYLYKYINFLRLGGLVTAGATIISNIVGYSIVSGVVSGETGEFVRVYMPAFFNYFVILFWFVGYLTKGNVKIKIYFPEMFLNLLGILLFLGRTRIIVLSLMLLFTFLFFAKTNKQRFRFVFSVLILIGTTVLIFNILHLPISMIYDRFSIGFEELKNPETALTGRFMAISLGFYIFSSSPIFGTGFVHPTSSYYLNYLITSRGIALTNSADFGLISILYTTGVLGFLIIINFIIKYIKTCYFYLRNKFYKKQYDGIFVFSFVVFTIVIFIFFVEQIAGNEFANRIMSVDLVSAGYAIKFMMRNKD